MLIIKNFKNYEGFKELFGVVEHGNGATSRKNKILLACLKDRSFLHYWRAFCNGLREDGIAVDGLTESDYLHALSMCDLKKFIRLYLNKVPAYSSARDGEVLHLLNFDSIDYRLCSRKYKLDNMRGLCTDGDTRSIRYVNVERDGRVFKMKAGKFISSIMEENPCTSILPEQVKRWIGEEFAREWQSYATRFSGDRFELHVDDNFDGIYSNGCCKGDFGSCMQGGSHADFYRYAVDCKAAYLTNEDEEIVARCIVFTDVRDDDDNRYRLAERQYASGQNDLLKQVLVDRLIAAGEIDGYKAVGADCHDNKNFVTNDGESLKDITLHIRCSLRSGDTLSYQDSFVFYNETYDVAYNDTCHDYDTELDDTSETYKSTNDVWSEYEDSYIPEDEAVRDEWFSDYILESDACWIKTGSRTYRSCWGRLDGNEDFVWSDFENAFLLREEAIDVGGNYEYDWRREEDCVLDINGDWRPELDCEYSEVLKKFILKDEAVWSDYRDAYLPEEESVFCETESDWQLKDEAYYSEVTERYYLSLESRLEDEETHKETHVIACV